MNIETLEFVEINLKKEDDIFLPEYYNGTGFFLVSKKERKEFPRHLMLVTGDPTNFCFGIDQKDKDGQWVFDYVLKKSAGRRSEHIELVEGLNAVTRKNKQLREKIDSFEQATLFEVREEESPKNKSVSEKFVLELIKTILQK